MAHHSDNPDYLLALILQSEFNGASTNKSVSGHKRISSPYQVEDGGPSPAKRNQTVSLIDPEWEVKDPTPDIHTLFMKFNKTFFWNTLGSVEVRWSPRMYKCAGLCSYEGRRGLCSIRLSEPLLKLRPRSDLIETLLHEMIHAYLFITNNNRDRDGHGPEFHKHMYRINKAAGTNISVYHDFHDEVKLYQKHWWRCNGPCQNNAPFFGMVKRSMNRNPGPNDFWWAKHQATCGGTFIKVREPPPKTNKVKNKIVNVSKSPDIRTYLGDKTSTANRITSINDLKKPISSTGGAIKKIPSKSTITAPGKGNYEKPSTNRVVGFGDLSNKKQGNVTTKIFGGDGKKLGTGVPKGKYNTGGTAVMNKGTGTVTVVPKLGNKSETKVNTKSKTAETFVPFFGSGHKLGGINSKLNGSSKPISPLAFNLPNSTKPSEISPEKFKDDFHNVTFSDDEFAEIEEVNGEPSNTNKNQYTPEKYKDEFLNITISDDELADVEEPDKRKKYKTSVDYCPEKYKDKFFNITISDDELADVEEPDKRNKYKNGKTSSDYSPEKYKDEFLDKSNSDDDLIELDINSDICKNSNDDIVPCPVCNFNIHRDDMGIHLQSCDILNTTLENMNSSAILENDDYDEEDDVNTGNKSDQILSPTEDAIVPCPCCSKYINSVNINKHLDECLSLLAIKEFEKEF